MSLTAPNEPFSIQIKMTSDWHVGSGSGRGEIDSKVQRDADELPYIPAKTLTGILRDGCEQVALALDGRNQRGQWHNQRGQWHNWVNFLFGDQPNTLDPKKYPEDQEKLELEPRPSVVSIQSARLDQTLREALTAKPQLKEAIAFIKPSVAIDPKTGSAKVDKSGGSLRFEEVVRMDAVLKSETCTLDFSGYFNITEDQKKVAFALLIAGTKMVDRLGGKRRRGNGNCEIAISDVKTEEWLQCLKEKHSKKIDQPPAWQKPTELKNSGEAIATDTTDTTWYAVPLTITTLTPIVLPKRTVGNVVECLDYIPGRYFLGHLHRVLGEYMDVSRAIGCGDLVMTNATLKIGSIAGRPTPFCLFGDKLDGGLSKGKGVYNRFMEAEPENNRGKKIQIKGERSGYVGQFDGSELPEYKTVKLKVNTHNTIDDKLQRPSQDTGGAVYSYQAIPAGETFEAELRLPQSVKEHLDREGKDPLQRLGTMLRIGQSKKDQYGLVQITAGDPELFAKQVKDDKLLYVWFLSDVLLRDERLNPTTDPKIFREMLEKELGVTLKERPDGDDDLLSLMMKPRRTESWQVRWGLPRPSMLGWQAGGCVVYKVKGEIKQEKLAELEARGIGDRRAEGYGQICFNDPLLMAKLSNKTRQSPASKQPEGGFTPILQSDPCFAYARTIEMAAWREAIANQAMAIAADEHKRTDILGIKILREKGQEPKSQPPMSQLGGLRSAIRRLTEQVSPNTVTRWIDAINRVDKRRDKWPLGSLETIRNLVTNFDLVWQELGDYSELSITQNGQSRLQVELWAEAVRTLVDEIIRAHKRMLEDEVKKYDEQVKTKGVK